MEAQPPILCACCLHRITLHEESRSTKEGAVNSSTLQHLCSGMQGEPEKKKGSAGFQKKKKSRYPTKIKRPWARAKHQQLNEVAEGEEEDTNNTPNENVVSLTSNEPKNDNEGEGNEETGEERSIGEAGWIPSSQPKSSKVKG